MKIILKIIGATLFLVFLFSCNSNSPKTVAKNFLYAIGKMDYEAAKKYGTEDTGKLLDMISGLSKLMADSSKKQHTYQIMNEKTDGDKATVTYKEDDKNEAQTLDIVKVEGQWKVAMTKESMNDAESGAFDSGATSTDTTSSDIPDEDDAGKK